MSRLSLRLSQKRCFADMKDKSMIKNFFITETKCFLAVANDEKPNKKNDLKSKSQNQHPLVISNVVINSWVMGKN